MTTDNVWLYKDWRTFACKDESEERVYKRVLKKKSTNQALSLTCRDWPWKTDEYCTLELIWQWCTVQYLSLEISGITGRLGCLMLPHSWPMIPSKTPRRGGNGVAPRPKQGQSTDQSIQRRSCSPKVPHYLGIFQDMDVHQWTNE